MNRNLISCSILALLVGAGFSLASTGAKADDMGVCNYTMKNMFAGPYKVCQNNIDEATCMGRAEEDENTDPSYSSAAECAADSAVGACTTAEHATTYYEGEPSGLAIGCGFQQGEWSDAE